VEGMNGKRELGKEGRTHVMRRKRVAETKMRR
jgi:hypothetical protein